MKFGITELSIVPVRSDKKEQSEQVTQLLFGDTFTIIERRKAWYHIISTLDNYEGWIDIKLATEISEELYNIINNQQKTITNDLISVIYKNKETAPIFIPAGSSLTDYNKETKSFSIGANSYSVDTYIENLNPKLIRKNIIKIAKYYLNAPYLWGGKTGFGIDCSGFSQIVYNINGLNIPRDASQQVKLGKTINILNDVQAGDLAFFDNNEGNIIHVGFFIDQKTIIHASGKVRIDNIDHQGIYNNDTKEYTHNLRVIKSII